MKRFIELYADPLTVGAKDKLTVVDVGAADRDMHHKKMFDHNKWNYLGLDITTEVNVDIVLRDPYNWPIANDSVDLVISGQAFEHIEYIWLTIEEIARIMKPNALCFIIAPANGPIHRHPVDCWRFNPDGFTALAKYAKLTPIVSELQWEKDCDKPGDLATWGDWKDVVLIAKKGT
jgi:SAM-dependent methyltransferase